MRPGRRTAVTVTHKSERTQLVDGLRSCLENAPGDRVQIPRALLQKVVRFLQPYGDVSYAEFGHLTKTEHAILHILFQHAPRFVPLADIVDILDNTGVASMSQSTLMVHKRRLLLKLLESNERIRDEDAHLPEDRRRPYTYVIGRANSGYAVVRKKVFYTEDELKTQNFGEHIL